MKSKINKHQKNSFTTVSKTIKQFSFALVIALITTLSSCSSSGSGGSAVPATGSFVKGKVAGSDFLSQGSFTAGGLNSGNLALQGTTATGKSIDIQLYAVDGTLETGTYNVNSTNADDSHVGSLTLVEVNTSTLTSTTYSSMNCDNANGTITITFIDATKVEGTFSFTGKEVKADETCTGTTKSVTNGSFRLVL